MAKTPNEILKHRDNYKDHIFEQYTLQELGNWVHLFAKRAGHRTNLVKASKDLDDAKNYLAIMGEILKAKAETVLGSFDESTQTPDKEQ